MRTASPVGTGPRGLRTQWSVGQGFFHSGEVSTDLVTVEYIYDCGAQRKYQSALEREVNEYLARQEEPVDLLYLSHFDFDHVSGLPYLLDRRHARRAILPLVATSERVIALGRYMYETRARAVPDWYLELLTDPVAYFGARDTPTVQVLPDQATPPRPPEEGEAADQATFRPPPPGTQSSGGATSHVSSGGASPEWLWIPWVLAAARTARDDFRNLLSGRLHVPLSDLEHHISDPATLRRHLQRDPSVFADIYRQCAPQRDRNFTSLCLYSGPLPHKRFDRAWRREADGPAWRTSNAPAAWLGSGDAPLGTDARAREFEEAFRKFAPAVGVFALPHHGSDRSYNSLLLQGLDERAQIVVSADQYSNWTHPGTAVTRAAAGRSGGLIVVTSDPATRWLETFSS